MKRKILVILIVALVTTPCLAQEVEPDGLFSLHGTRWGFGPLIMFSIFPPSLVETYAMTNTMGFYLRTVYSCSETECRLIRKHNYINKPVLSVVYPDNNFFPFWSELYVMQPIGFGVHTNLWWWRWCSHQIYCWVLTFEMGIMLKVDDNWSPPEEE